MAFGEVVRCEWGCHSPLYSTLCVQGMLAVVDPEGSWTSKWTHHRKHVPGCYALSVESSLQPHIEEILENHGVKVRND